MLQQYLISIDARLRSKTNISTPAWYVEKDSMEDTAMLEKYRHSHFSLINSNKDRCCTDIIEKKNWQRLTVLINSDNSLLLIRSDGAEKLCQSLTILLCKLIKMILLTPAYAVRTANSDMCKKNQRFQLILKYCVYFFFSKILINIIPVNLLIIVLMFSMQLYNCFMFWLFLFIK